MPSRSTFRMEGGKELAETLRRLGPETATKAGASGMRKAANIMRDAVKEAAPYDPGDTKRTYTKGGPGGSRESVEVDYGHLRDNIKTRKVRSAIGHTISFMVTTGAAFWGRFSEFGTEHEPARPWFKPALDMIAPKVVQNITVELRKAIDRTVRRARK